MNPEKPPMVTVYTSDVQQGAEFGPNPAPVLQQIKPKRFTAKKLLLGSLLFILAIPGILFMVVIVFLAVSGSVKMLKLNNHANGLKNELNSVVFIEGQSVKATAVVDGDSLTANDNPAVSTFAQGSLTVDRSLANIESEVNENLSNSGFIYDGAPKYKYYSTSHDGRSYDSVTFRYLKGDHAIRVVYKFDKSYGCPSGYTCKHTSKTKPTDMVYPVNNLGKIRVTKLNIHLADKSSDYHVGYL